MIDIDTIDRLLAAEKEAEEQAEKARQHEAQVSEEAARVRQDDRTLSAEEMRARRAQAQDRIEEAQIERLRAEADADEAASRASVEIEAMRRPVIDELNRLAGERQAEVLEMLRGVCPEKRRHALELEHDFRGLARSASGAVDRSRMAQHLGRWNPVGERRHHALAGHLRAAAELI